MVNRILSIVGWIGTALVGVAVAVAYVPTLSSNYGQYSRPLALAGLICVLAYTASQWREIGTFFSGRQARYGGLAATSTLVMLGILVAINYIGAKQNKRWDLTTNKQFSLADQSRNVLAKLDATLQVQVFAQQPEFPQYQDKMKEYEYASKNISVEYIDPDKKPTVAKQNQIQQYGTIVFNYKGRTERVTSDSEQDITNGIIKVVTGQQKKVYFSQGHGEKDTGSANPSGYNAIVAALGRENYTVDKLVIAQQGAVPDDASIVVVAGPRADFFTNEIDALKAYLAKAGKLLLELDPPEKADSPALTNLVTLARDWGITVGDDIVIDLSSRVGDAAIPVAANYPSHPISERFNLMSAFPLARSVSPISGGSNGHTAQPVIETGPRSWAEADIKGLLSGTQPEIDEAKSDKKGPIVIASAVSAAATTTAPQANADAPKPETRLVVVGDSDFASNSVLGIPGNRDLFMNVIGWLAQQENLISIRPKEQSDRRLTLTSTQHIVILSLLIIPACIFGTGVYTWWRRR